ncbi:MAG TPA: adenylate/guanylate cyclase domain-containing protein [Candidatus Dormibacteraeota bacterium]|nr:adenylate/guanylate cyclase domain-containing protein [Candidatus Dormibacteraeota bacterium]
MQPGIVGLRGAITAAWERDLRAVRQDRFDMGGDKAALAFIQRFYSLVSDLRAPIQRAWGLGGHVHVADSPVAGPGPRVSQTRIKLRNHGDLVALEAFTYIDGTPRPNPSLGLDREIRVAEVAPYAIAQELYRRVIDFLQVALNIDLSLNGASWLYEQVVANYFVANGRWPTVGEVYQRTTREYAVEDSFERVISLFAPSTHGEGSGGNGSAPNGDFEVALSLEQLQRCRDTQADLENFVQVVRRAVDADQDSRPVTSEDAARELGLETPALMKLGRLLALAPDVSRDGEFSSDYSQWSFLPSYNVHFFRRVNAIDDYLVVAATLLPRAADEGSTTTSPGTAFKVEPGWALPDGIVTFLMTDVVESTPLWLQSRAQMYAAMRRHDQLLAGAIEANGGIVLKERGEGDSFFAVFLRATDAVAAALEAQRAIHSEPWPDRIHLSVRMAILTGEADARDRDYRSPAVNRCAKLRRRAIGNQVLVSEATYSIVADILRGDIKLVSVGKRMLEGHDRPEEVYVLQHDEVALENVVAEDEVTV